MSITPSPFVKFNRKKILSHNLKTIKEQPTPFSQTPTSFSSLHQTHLHILAQRKSLYPNRPITSFLKFPSSSCSNFPLQSNIDTPDLLSVSPHPIRSTVSQKPNTVIRSQSRSNPQINGDEEDPGAQVQDLVVPQQWLTPSKASEESEWLRVTLHHPPSMALRYMREFLASEAFRNAGREVRDVVPLLVKFVCCLQITKTHLFTVTLSYGPSMLPTIGLAGNLCLAERISTRFDKVGPGDIVLVRSPQVPWKIMTKRLIAMEGQSVSYVVDPSKSDVSDTIVVPKGHVWVQGDNVYESNDSRKFGAVPYGLLEGRVFWRIWPPKDFGSLMQSKGKDSVS